MTYEITMKKRAEAAIKPIIDTLNQIYTEPEPDDESLSSVMDMIDEQKYLRIYIDSWADAECNFNTWCKKHGDLSNKLKQYVSGYECYLESGGDGRAVIYNRPTGKSLDRISSSGEMSAIRSFLRIIQSPIFD